MWIFAGAIIMFLIALITRPFSTGLALLKFLAFSVAAVSAFALYMGGPMSMYAGPAVVGGISWLALQFVPMPRHG
ncbi:hypothetical protein AAG742_03515 [Micrococcus sp. 2A]|uniref:hypothetical protein n=1 Tax=Micrococcus sp. 2A TaxID=3142261 RepID=UPI0031BB1BC5